jgi:hypothetical protein
MLQYYRTTQRTTTQITYNISTLRYRLGCFRVLLLIGEKGYVDSGKRNRGISIQVNIISTFLGL